MPALPVTRLTPEEYLAIERAAEFKSEYFDGQMFAMSGVSRQHYWIASRIQFELTGRLRGGPCRCGGSDLRVRSGVGGFYTYPDLLVVCGEERYADNQFDMLLNPAVLVEILSDSTEAKDRGFKFHQYKAIEALKEYVLVSQKEPRIEIFDSVDAAKWQVTEFSGMEAIAHFAAIGCHVPLRDIYSGIEGL